MPAPFVFVREQSPPVDEFSRGVVGRGHSELMALPIIN
jgi:hypothetical protein